MWRGLVSTAIILKRLRGLVDCTGAAERTMKLAKTLNQLYLKIAK
jgi:hypothetical protein